MMSNPLYQMFNGGQVGNMPNMIQQFNQFRKQFKGDPRQQVQELLNSGKVSQAQYDQAVQMAKAMQNMLRM